MKFWGVSWHTKSVGLQCRHMPDFNFLTLFKYLSWAWNEQHIMSIADPHKVTKSSEHSAMSKRDVCQERQCCEGQVGCFPLALCLCNFYMLVLPFRQMDLSTALFRTGSDIHILQVCSHSLQLLSWGLRKVTTITHNGSSWECGKVSPVQRVPAIHHHRITEFLEVCMLAFSGWVIWQSNLLPTVRNFGWVPVLDLSKSCAFNIEGRKRKLQGFWLSSSGRANSGSGTDVPEQDGVFQMACQCKGGGNLCYVFMK